VIREVREEVGVEVDNLRYFGSQSWPFPNSLMIAFRAEYAGGDLRPIRPNWPMRSGSRPSRCRSCRRA
jgi:NADH pyrophosphatase NudC (nudix superfamily)